MKNLIKALHKYYSEPLATAFKQFRAGIIYFSVGLISVIMANTHLQPSLQQEIIVFLGLLLTGIGFFIALMAEMRLLISRFIHFFTHKKPKP